MIETSSDLLRSSSAIFGNLRKMSGNLRKCSETFVRHSGQFWKIFGNLRKMVGNLRKIVTFYIIKRKLHGRLEIRNFSSHVENYFTRSLRSLVKYFSTLEDKFRISARPCNILSISNAGSWNNCYLFWVAPSSIPRTRCVNDNLTPSKLPSHPVCTPLPAYWLPFGPQY